MTDVSELVKRIADAISPFCDALYALFGHSMGALLGFELARELRRRGQPAPRHFFAAAFRAPQLPQRTFPIHGLPDHEFLAEVQQRFSGIPSEIAENPSLLALFLPVLRSDIKLVEAYHYYGEPPVDCPITVLGGTDDRQVSVADLAAWRMQTVDVFRQKMLPGDHFFVAARLAEVTRVVRNALA